MWADVDYDDDYSIDNDHDDFNEDEDDDDDDDEANNSCELAVPPSHIRNVWKAASGTLRGGGAKPKGEEQKKGNGNDVIHDDHDDMGGYRFKNVYGRGTKWILKIKENAENIFGN